MCNMMKCFISEFKRVAIEKVCWKTKTKDWYYMSAIKFCYNAQNDFNTKYMANNQKKRNLMEKFTITCHLQISFRVKIMRS